MIHRIIHNILNIKAAVTYVPYQDLENKMMLVGFLDSIQKLPKFLRPNVREAERLHQIEKKLYVGLWMRAKRGLEDGTGHVRTGSSSRSEDLCL